MRILAVDERSRIIKIVPETLDDLWHLERVIEKGDWVSGGTDRKIKGEDGKETMRVKLFVQLEAEKVEFQESTGNLRVNGIILECKPPEFLDLKAHQSIDVQTGKPIEIVKKIWGRHHIERLEKAKKATHKNPVLIVVMDDESATFAFLKEFKLEMRGTINAGRHGKMFDGEDNSENNYLKQILEKIQEYNPENSVIAGPGFTKDKLKKFLLGKKLKGKIFYEGCNSVGVTGLNELLRTGILDKIAEETQISKETKLVEKLFEHLGKNDKLAVYGIKEAENAVNMRAVSELLVLDKVLLSRRDEIEELMKSAENAKANVNIISSEHEAGKKLESVTGVAALLRFPVE